MDVLGGRTHTHRVLDWREVKSRDVSPSQINWCGCIRLFQRLQTSRGHLFWDHNFYSLTWLKSFGKRIVTWCYKRLKAFLYFKSKSCSEESGEIFRYEKRGEGCIVLSKRPKWTRRLRWRVPLGFGPNPKPRGSFSEKPLVDPERWIMVGLGRMNFFFFLTSTKTKKKNQNWAIWV